MIELLSGYFGFNTIAFPKDREVLVEADVLVKESLEFKSLFITDWYKFLIIYLASKNKYFFSQSVTARSIITTSP